MILKEESPYDQYTQADRLFPLLKFDGVLVKQKVKKEQNIEIDESTATEKEIHPYQIYIVRTIIRYVLRFFKYNESVTPLYPTNSREPEKYSLKDSEVRYNNFLQAALITNYFTFNIDNNGWILICFLSTCNLVHDDLVKICEVLNALHHIHHCKFPDAAAMISPTEPYLKVSSGATIQMLQWWGKHEEDTETLIPEACEKHINPFSK